jgi:hypothetical protein
MEITMEKEQEKLKIKPQKIKYSRKNMKMINTINLHS